MDGFLKQSTAVDLPIGPFLDDGDGVTPMTALTIAQADVRLKKNNGAWAQVNDATSATHEENGNYEKEFDATDTNTLGILRVHINESGALPVWHTYMVIPANVWDSLFGGTDTLDVQVTGIGANVITATAINADAITAAKIADGAIDAATFAAGAINAAAIANAAIDAATFAADVDAEILSYIVDDATRIDASALNTAAVTTVPAILDDTDDIGVAGAGLTAVPWNAAWDAQVESEVADALAVYDPPTKAELDTAVANVSVDEIQATALADLFNTDSGTTYASAVAGSVVKETADNASGASLTVQDIVDGVWDEPLASHLDADSTGEALDAAGGGVSAADIADAVWDEATAGHTTSGTFGEQAKTDIDAILADSNELQVDWVNGGRLDLILDARSSQASVDTIDNFLDTEIGEILTDTGTTLDGKLNSVLTLLDDARTEPGQGAPPVNPDLATKIDYLYKAWRNKKDNNGAVTNLYADNATTIDHKQTTAEAGGVVTKGEWATGA